MSTVIFNNTPGSLVAINEPAVQGQIVLPPLFKIDPAISYRTQRAIISSIGVAQQVSHQFMTTLGGGIYVYVFGDQVGRISLGGLMVPHSCENGDDLTHGLEKMMEYYDAVKLSARGRSPCVIVLGRALTLNAFLVGINTRVVDEQAKLVQFEMAFMTLPGNALKSDRVSAKR